MTKHKAELNGNGNDKEVLAEMKKSEKRAKVKIPVMRGFVLTSNPEKWRNYEPDFSYGSNYLSF